MEEGKRSSAALRISSSTMTTSEITHILATEPTRALEKGELMSPRNPNSRVRERYVWILKSNLDASTNLGEHISQLLLFIESKVESFGELVSQCEIEIFCGFSSIYGQGGFSLEPHILQKMTLVPLILSLDLYPPPQSEEDLP